ncbi:hypothetical protein QYZ88_017410 [Lachnospiraceae bacterium C1.1]|nr:hypothetical protein [Lachnospiraceae bacterium C1.1]
MNKKLFAGIFAAIFIMTVFFSCLFIAEEINHECSGAERTCKRNSRDL